LEVVSVKEVIGSYVIQSSYGSSFSVMGEHATYDEVNDDAAHVEKEL
jgi:hypothetical protein